MFKEAILAIVIAASAFLAGREIGQNEVRQELLYGAALCQDVFPKERYQVGYLDCFITYVSETINAPEGTVYSLPGDVVE